MLVSTVPQGKRGSYLWRALMGTGPGRFWGVEVGGSIPTRSSTGGSKADLRRAGSAFGGGLAVAFWRGNSADGGRKRLSRSAGGGFVWLTGGMSGATFKSAGKTSSLKLTMVGVAAGLADTAGSSGAFDCAGGDTATSGAGGGSFFAACFSTTLACRLAAACRRCSSSHSSSKLHGDTQRGGFTGRASGLSCREGMALRL